MSAGRKRYKSHARQSNFLFIKETLYFCRTLSCSFRHRPVTPRRWNSLPEPLQRRLPPSPPGDGGGQLRWQAGQKYVAR